MKTNSKRIIYIISIISISILLFGTAYATYNKVINDTNGAKMVVGDIYLRYINGATKNITMIPSDTYNPNDYFEFQIVGKNTSNKNIIYNIVLNHGDELPNPAIRLADRFLKFRLVKVNNNVETELSIDDEFEDISNAEIYSETIDKNTIENVNITYRLYVWVSGLIVGNLDGADYTQEEWPNVYTNINLSVYGDFVGQGSNKKVTVTFNPLGGVTPTSTKRVNYNGTYGKLPTPTREGYTFLGWKEKNIPFTEYQELEYIPFKMGDYIDTGIIPTNHMTEIKFDYDEYYDDEFLFGTSRGSYYYYFSSYSNKYAFGHDGNMGYTNTGTWTTGIHTLIYNGDNNSVILDDEELESGYNISSTTTLWIGKRNTSANFNGKVYYMKITNKETGNLERYFIPCLRRTDDIVGLYDLVNGIFYENQNQNIFNFTNKVDGYITSTSNVVNENDHTLYAMWAHNPTITLDAVGGIMQIGSKVVNYDGKYGDLPTPTREGYNFLGWKEKNIPDDYQEVEYIKFYSNTFIDTGIIPTNHTTEIKFDFEEYYDDEFLFGTSMGSSYYYFSSYSKKYAFGHNGTGGYTNTGTWSTGIHTLIYNGDNNIVNLDNNILEYGRNISSPTTLWIGKRNTSANFNGKIYYVKITNKTTGDLERYLIPCYRKIDNVIGMYDTISGNFYTANAEGSFTKGNNVNNYITSNTQLVTNSNHTLYAIWGHNPTLIFDANGGEVSPSRITYNYNETISSLPIPTRNGYRFVMWTEEPISSYRKLSFIKAKDTQYIDTNYPLWQNQNWKMEFKFEVSEFYDYNNMFGSLDQSNTSNEIWIDSSKKYYIRIGGISKTLIFTLDKETPYIVIHDNTGSNLLNYVNGNLVKTLTRANTSFNSNLGFGHRVGAYYLKGKIYYLKFWSNNQLVRDMVPCYNINTNQTGMFDLTNKVFYHNMGGDEFDIGEELGGLFVPFTVNDVKNADHTLYAIWEEN